MSNRGITNGIAALALFTLCLPVSGQEPINATASATQPSPGHVILREQFRFSSYDLREGPRERRGEFDDYTLRNMLNVGLRSDLSLTLQFSGAVRRRDFDFGGSQSAEGIGDVAAMLKWRVYQDDSTALNTARLSLLGGMEFRAGDSPFTTDGYNPMLGVAFTKIAGRHGFNGSLHWTFTTGGSDEPILPGESSADLLRYDLAYLFRLAPKTYTAETEGAWYALCELNGSYETNGDHEVLLAPGIMYEARTWVAELSVQLPVFERVDHRATLDYAVIAGLRFSW